MLLELNYHLTGAQDAEDVERQKSRYPELQHSKYPEDHDEQRRTDLGSFIAWPPGDKELLVKEGEYVMGWKNLAFVSEHQYLSPFNPSPAMHRVQNLARQDDPEPLAYFTRGGEIVTNNRGEPLGKFLLIPEWWTDTLPGELIATIRDAYEGSLNMGKDSELRKRCAHEVTDQEWKKIANKLIRLEGKARLKCSGLSRKEGHDKVTNQDLKVIRRFPDRENNVTRNIAWDIDPVSGQMNPPRPQLTEKGKKPTGYDLWAGHWWSWEAPGDEVEQSQRLRDIVTVDDICERRKCLDKYSNGAKIAKIAKDL